MTNKRTPSVGDFSGTDPSGPPSRSVLPDPSTQRPRNPSRRNFLAAMGATVASINTAACIRKPMERILPFGKRPEELVPGDPQYFATSICFGESVIGLLACSTDGRPTKIEGNPQHPMSHGATNAWAQASVLGLYDPERTRTAFDGETPVPPEKVAAQLSEMATKARESAGRGLAVVVDDTPSPTLDRLLNELVEKLPGAKIYGYDAAGSDNALAGARMVGIEDAAWTYAGTPGVIAAFDADPMATEGDVVAFTRMFAAGRAAGKDPKEATRLYAAEPQLSLTGSNADHRVAIRGAQVADLLAAVAHHLKAAGLDLPNLPLPAEIREHPFAQALAADLAARPKGSTLVLVGDRQPPQAHALGFVINAALGNLGKTLVFTERKRSRKGDLRQLAAAIEAGAVEQLVVLGSNPVHDAGGELGLAKLVEDVPSSLYLGLHRDETGQVAKWHVPKSHYLETWGDLVARDGTISIQQPLIAPLYESMSEIEVLARLLGKEPSGYELVRETLEPLAAGSFDKTWQKWLHDGVAIRRPAKPVMATPHMLRANWSPGPVEDGYELDFVRDASVLDGRFANSPWLQELPDPITKLAWDNAALVSSQTAKKLKVENGQIIEIAHHGTKLRIPVWVQPGTADGVVVLPIGYGRPEGGRYAKSGFSVSALRLEGAQWILTGATAKATSRTYTLACVQPETSLHGRPHVRSATRADFTEDENFVEKFEVMDAKHVRTLLWEEPFQEVDHRWGMSIDLNSCTGCGACTVACQAENNIPWVGKEEVLKGREMHWIRVDRYFDEESGKIQFDTQPIPCMQCETAPCENVCPVAATVHSPEGLNDMVYNRCIGTRYCSNNCPYKVRRFNFFHYSLRNDEEYGMGIAMQRNPDVTVRYRGVMEKCTYCVQRINRAKIDAKVYRDGNVRDGEVITACAQVCAAQAITFGNLNDESSQVAKKQADPRSYAVLAEINTRPRTTFLAKLTNPNPELDELANG